MHPVKEPTDAKYYPSTSRPGWGSNSIIVEITGSQRYFKEAVEKAPYDDDAWGGLAASYDRLRRFDLADQAYASANTVGRRNSSILNDQGYSLMLRGDLNGAHKKFNKRLRARSRQPGYRQQHRVAQWQPPVHRTAAEQPALRFFRSIAVRAQRSAGVILWRITGTFKTTKRVER